MKFMRLLYIIKFDSIDLNLCIHIFRDFSTKVMCKYNNNFPYFAVKECGSFYAKNVKCSEYVISKKR